MGLGAITVMTAIALWAYRVRVRHLDLILGVGFSTIATLFYCTDYHLQRATLLVVALILFIGMHSILRTENSSVSKFIDSIKLHYLTMPR